MLPKVARKGDCSLLGPIAILMCLVGLVVYSGRNWKESLRVQNDTASEDILIVSGISRDRKDMTGLKNLVTSAKLTMGNHATFLIFVDDASRHREIETWDSVRVMYYRELLANTGVRSIHKSHDHWMAMVREGFKYSKYILYATADYQFRRSGSFSPLIDNHKGHFAVMNHHRYCGTELQGFRNDSQAADKILTSWVGHPMREFNTSTSACIPSYAIGIDLAPGATVDGKSFTPRVNSTFIRRKVNVSLHNLKRLPKQQLTVRINNKITAVFMVMLPVELNSFCRTLHVDDCSHSTVLEGFVDMLRQKSFEYEVAVVASIHLPLDAPRSRFTHWEQESIRISKKYSINTKVVVIDKNTLKNPSSFTFNILSDAAQRSLGSSIKGYCVVNPMAELPTSSGWESLPHKFETYRSVGVHDPLNSSFCISASSKRITSWLVPPSLSITTSTDWFDELFDEPKSCVVKYQNKKAAESIVPDAIHRKARGSRSSQSRSEPLNEYGVFMSAANLRFQEQTAK